MSYWEFKCLVFNQECGITLGRLHPGHFWWAYEIDMFNIRRKDPRNFNYAF